MTNPHLRFSRQIRLPEIGKDGQSRLCSSNVTVRSTGFVRTIERRYVRLAGLNETDEAAGPSVDPEVVERTAGAVALGLRHAAARDVAEGALRALISIRAALGLPVP